MLHLTWKGLRGRRRESLLLLIVLILSFLLSSALGTILPSTQAALQLQRERNYGKWQLMAYQKTPELCTALEQAAEARGARTARFTTVAQTEDGDVISVLNEDVLELGQFALAEGRLPEAANEIVLVDTQFTDMQGIAVGDTIRLQLSREVASSDSAEVRESGMAKLNEITALAQAADTTDYRQRFYDQVEQASARGGEARVVISNSAARCGDAEVYALFQDNLKFGRPLLEGMSEEQIETLYQSYLENGIQLYYNMSSRSNERVLVPYDGATISVVQTVSRVTLQGMGYGEYRGTSIALGKASSYMTMAVSYTVTGIIKGYASTWDSGGHTMPNAFVSEAGAELVMGAVSAAKAAIPELIVPEFSDTLLLQSSGDAAEFYEEMAETYIAAAEPRYTVELYTNRTYNNTEGFLTGALETPNENGETVYKSFSFSTRNGQVFVGTENGEPFVRSGMMPEESGAAEGEWVSLTELSSPDFRIDGLAPLSVTLPTVEELYRKNEFEFRINTYTYPDDSGSSDATLNTVLNGILMLITAFAVLVICLVQCKRRARSIVLLRAIGLTNAQGARMQLYEAGFFLLLSLAAGLPLGLLCAVTVLKAMGSGEVTVTDWGFLLRSAALGAASLLAGLQLPLLTAMRMPLTGRTGTIDPASGAADGKPLNRSGLMCMETAARRFNRRRDRTARILCAVALILSLLTLLLAHLALDTYRSEVERTDMPDYTLSTSFAMSSRYLREKEAFYASGEALDAQPARVEAYLAAEGVYLNNFKESPIVSALDEDAFCVAGLSEDSAILSRLLALCGEINTEKLLSGEGCILLMPNYLPKDGGELQFSADSVDALRFKTDDTIEAGDILSLTAYTHSVSEGSGVVGNAANVEVEVLAVLHEYSGIWLFGESAHPLTAVSGQKLITALYPNASQRYNADQVRWNARLSQLHCENCKGKTYVNFYTSDDGDHAAAYWNLAQDEGLEMKNYQKEKAERLAAGENQRALTVLLGAAAVLLVLIILAFILSDLAEQSRRRVGILRALGVSGGSMMKTQLLLSMRDALGAALTANSLMALLLLVCAVIETGGHTAQPSLLLITLREGLLWQYPWRLHVGLCLGLWALISLLRALPYRSLCRQSVIGTIKGLDKGE